MPCCVELKHMCKIPPPCESPPALTPPPPPSFVPVKSREHHSVEGRMQGILHQAGVSVFHCCCLIPGWGRGCKAEQGRLSLELRRVAILRIILEYMEEGRGGNDHDGGRSWQAREIMLEGVEGGSATNILRFGSTRALINFMKSPSIAIMTMQITAEFFMKL